MSKYTTTKLRRIDEERRQVEIQRNQKIEARMQTLTKLILGHAVEMTGYDNDKICFAVNGLDKVFSDKRIEYPSEKLIANLLLAVDAAGYSRGAFDIPDFENGVVTNCLNPGRYAPSRIFASIQREKERTGG